MDKIRCSHCRGGKKVAKLGGMMGDCNLCNGTGLMNQCDKPQSVVAAPVENASDIIKAVASVAAVKIEKPASEAVEIEQPAMIQPKVDPKKAIYKRKTAAKQFAQLDKDI